MIQIKVLWMKKKKKSVESSRLLDTDSLGAEKKKSHIYGTKL